MATKKMNPGFMAMMKNKAGFEKSGKDVEKKGVKEGSKKDMAMDKKQMMGMKKGGGVDGVAKKGKTKGKIVKMCSGGMK